ncbi:MAG: hypothetical protein R2867_21640 [Caldilineaceae bacterium]
MSSTPSTSPARLGRAQANFWQSPYSAWGIYILAFVTRCWRLAYHSVWFDEAVSLQWAGSDPTFIWQKTFPSSKINTHPFTIWVSMPGRCCWVGSG